MTLKKQGDLTGEESLNDEALEAVARGDLKALKLLIAKGADINSGVSGRSLLMIAISTGRLNIIKYLIGNGADVNAKDSTGKTVDDFINEIMPDCQTENEEEAWKHSPEYDVWCDIHSLVSNRREFLQATNKKNSKNPKQLFEALYVKKNYELARLLIEKGADVNAKDKDGKTPLMYIIQELYDENDVKKGLGMAGFLLKKGANINAKQKDGWSALSLSHNVVVIKWLAKKGADVNTQDNYGMTPLMSAVTDEWGFERVKCLLELDANPNLKDMNGKTALMYSATSPYKESRMTKLLIEKGADVNARDKDGNTALIYAAMKYSNNPGAISLLINNGADVAAKNKDGITALKLAIKNEKKEEVVLLEKFSKKK